MSHPPDEPDKPAAVVHPPGGIEMPWPTMLLDIFHRGARIEAQVEQVVKEQGRASEQRGLMWQAINELRVDVALLRSTIDRIEPIVKADEERRHVLGALASVCGRLFVHSAKFAWGAVVVAFGYVGYLLHDKLPNFLHWK